MGQKKIDAQQQQALAVRMQERRWLLAASLIVLLSLVQVYREKTVLFAEQEVLLRAGAVVNLSTLERPEPLLPVFAQIYSDTADQRLAAEHVLACILRERTGRLLPWTLPNVGVLNTPAFALPAAEAAAGGEIFRARLEGRTARRVRAGGERLRVPLLGGPRDLGRIKDRLVVRSPGVFRWSFWGLAAVLFGAFLGLHLFWFRRRFAGDPALLPVVLLLTGLGLAVMIGMQDPLRDLLLAQGFVGGVAAGTFLLGAVSGLDFQRRFWRRRTYGWLGLSLLTAALLYRFGTGPGGSDAKVNLALPWIGTVQPVEAVKLLLLLFFAGYFARNWAFLRHLKQRAGLPRPLRGMDFPRLRDLLPAAGGTLLALLTCYLLRDMGPALVVGCTFLALYGTARSRWQAVGAGFAVLGAGFWLAYRTEVVPVVAQRIQMLLSPWENFVVGGEHLAHAYWALAAGGLGGQGVGAGEANHIPAAHTDMVLAAVGEELGLLGLLSVLVLYSVLALRSLRIALHAGGTYSLFLGLGAALLLLSQVVFIAGGVLGLLPLSGVVTPFLSYGKSSMVANCILVGVLASLSARTGNAVQAEAQQVHFRRPLRVLAVLLLLLLGGLAAKAYYVQVDRADAWTLRPALVLQGTLERAYTYNPRVYEAARRIPRGSIYDRNGIPLATSLPEEIEGARPALEALGLDLEALSPTAERLYPFGPLTFYLLGDLRTRVKWGAGNSLYAEHRYLSHLRGYDNHPRAVEKRRVPRGMPEPIIRYSYAELLPLARPTWGRRREARALLARARDLHLTIDVRLQQRVAEVLAERVGEGKTASALVLDAATGEVLASVTYPLPEAAYADPAAAHRDPALFDRGYGRGAKPPGSTFKLVTAMAALRRDAGAEGWTWPVRAWDRYARRGEPTGEVGLARAVIASSNVYFAALAHEVAGPDTLLGTLEAFGFGLGPPGLTARQKRELLRQPDNLRQAGFGQGPVTGSPLQVALVAATIANDGRRPNVHWVRRPSRPLPQPVLSAHQARTLAGYLRRVVTDPDGTARVLRGLSVPAAGKTGTAEERELIIRDGRTVPVTVNHAWFTGFAPYREAGRPAGRRIAVAVLVERGGSGGRVAAPIAGAIFEEAASLGLIR